MKTIVIIISFFLFFIENTFAQDHNSNLFISNGYFAPDNANGDGTWRYGEARWLPIGDYKLQFGPYIMAMQLRSKINDFNYSYQEYGLGLASNFAFKPGWNYHKFGWLNAGWKRGFSEGSIVKSEGIFKNAQIDQLLFFSGGLALRKVILEGPFAQQKISISGQTSLKNEYDSYWNEQPLEEIPFGRNSISVNVQNYFWPIDIDWRNEVFLMPHLGISYTERNKEAHYGASLGVTIAKGYDSREILSLGYKPTWHKSRTDIFEVTLNILNLFIN
jgi:hypothetical protein